MKRMIKEQSNYCDLYEFKKKERKRTIYQTRYVPSWKNMVLLSDRLFKL